jgi:hypothetical protein
MALTDEQTRSKTDRLSPLGTLLAVVGGATVLAAIAAVLVDPVVVRPMGMGRGMGREATTAPFREVRVFISTFNVLIILALVWSYLSVYRDLPNRFTGSLLLVTGALLLYALASNPVVHLLFGFGGNTTLGPFAFLPDLFAAVAVSALLYQSLQ